MRRVIVTLKQKEVSYHEIELVVGDSVAEEDICEAALNAWAGDGVPEGVTVVGRLVNARWEQDDPVVDEIMEGDE